jgi:DNA replication protein DnaC
MTDELDQLLASLRLKRLREIVARELERAAAEQIAYEDLLVRLFREQWRYRQDRSLHYRIDVAKLPEQWSLDTFPYAQQPGVHAPTIRQLAGLDWIAAGMNLVLVGPAGVGKTGLAIGFLLKALQSGHRGLFIKAQDLFDDMYQSLADRSTRRLLDRLVRIDVLVCDELGYLTLRPEQQNIFFKLMDERYVHHRPTIITTNLDYDDWYGFLGNRPMVDALLDRLRHRCQTLRINGPSLRAPTEPAVPVNGP